MRGLLPPAFLAACLLGLAACLLGLGACDAADEPLPERVYHAARPGSLAEAQRRLAAGDAKLRGVLDTLVREADKLLAVRPPSVTQKRRPAPGGDPHDYCSLAPYYWPDASTPDGLPYVRRDGRRNPEADDERFTDRDRAGRLGSAVETLGLAWRFTGRKRYAEHAAAFVRTWFIDEASRMNPHLRYAQAVRGTNEGRGAGIIEGRDLVAAIDAVALIDDAGVLSTADRAAIDAWAGGYLDWLLESDPGHRERAAANNHGSFFDAQVVQLALMTGRRGLAVGVLEEAGPRRIAVQIEPDGSQPHELVRTKSLGYSAFNLEALCHLATLAEHVDVDLWRHETRDGRSIRRAIDFLVPYVPAPERWPHQQISRLAPDDFATILWRAGIVYRDPTYAALVDGFSSDRDGWIRLTFVED
jgi:hypothetical protein